MTDSKIKREKGCMDLQLVPTHDIAAELGKRINSRQAQIDGYRSLMLTYITDVDSIFDRTFRQN